MKEREFKLIEKYMLRCMSDSAHDREHVYRVLFTALEIAEYENSVDYDVLITACLLHDIGRREQFENPAVCHAEVGAKKHMISALKTVIPRTLRKSCFLYFNSQVQKQ